MNGVLDNVGTLSNFFAGLGAALDGIGASEEDFGRDVVLNDGSGLPLDTVGSLDVAFDDFNDGFGAAVTFDDEGSWFGLDTYLADSADFDDGFGSATTVDDSGPLFLDSDAASDESTDFDDGFGSATSQQT
ncbi:hypothetical protein CDD81_7204 [Ophiocordyceps australis]|uniref:Uncharacterized protein n=1 Tax=Ophiocordyceps australis TaxID=1399860 RepID=A0A2C5Y530_9HYPO|nr:hypothetical protein CDD81_7204 [Ophiocordyceps australis]